ncbi:BrnT family toxin [Novosphingobium resinovorum]|uniref:BrnT family toxin n=1 Tax=Novosphingobium resinovorum TaxID=158500 RepID=UPI001E5BC30D|nr:BrnT family toxin [Novosphingobium resinovorum]
MRIFEDTRHEVLPSFRLVYGEDRYKAVGLVDGKLFTVVYVLRDDRVRLISVRRSNAGEQRDYDRNSG